MREKEILIADGHHRYETSLAYQAEHPDRKVANYRMMTLVNMSGVGPVILPIHRLVKELADFNPDASLASLRKAFTVRTYPGESSAVRAAVLDAIRDHQAEGRHALGLYVADGNYHVLVLRRGDLMNDIPGHSETWRRLDVNIVQHLILEEQFGINTEHSHEAVNVEYIQDFPYMVQEAANRVKSGEAQLLLLLNPTRVEEVQAVAHNGERMPQKSTFFYPKAYTGMVFHCMDG